MHSSVRDANFQALLSDDREMRSHVSELVEVFEAIRTEDVRGTRLAHMVDAAHVTQRQPDLVYDRTRLRQSSLPDSVLASFIQFLNSNDHATAGSSNLNSLAHTAITPEAGFLDSFSLRGVQYSTKSSQQPYPFSILPVRQRIHGTTSINARSDHTRFPPRCVPFSVF